MVSGGLGDVFNKYIVSHYVSVSAAVPKGSNISSDELILMFENTTPMLKIVISTLKLRY